MPTSPTPDDLLALARFCWPGQTHLGIRCALIAQDLNHCAAAEAVLIERGLGEEYGGELARQLERDGRPMGIDPTQDMVRVYSRWILHAATAPLDARVRAMVQVVRAEEAKRGS